VTTTAATAPVDISEAVINEFDRTEMRRTANPKEWQHLIQPFRSAQDAKALALLVMDLVGIGLSSAAALWAFTSALWLTPVFVLLSAGFLVRVFIISHDCGHGSYFSSQKWNERFGVLVGGLMLTPFYMWRRAHATHHATTGDLDRRGVGDIPTMTVREYRALSPLARIGYRILRNPFVLLGGGGLFVFFISHRLSAPMMWGFKDPPSMQERINVHVTTLLGLGGFALMWVLGGWTMFFLHLVATMIAAVAGLFLFYAQHQYETVYWRRRADWNYLQASMEGSSWLKLPAVLQFFSGNIGIHHIHHLAPKVPNYRLQACVDSHETLRKGVVTLGAIDALRTLGLKVYDEDAGQMLSWRELDALPLAVPAE
jgi:acyl-lipid omega-6 desaturase (Delta-12 desaturase)